MTKYFSFFILILFAVFTSCDNDNNDSLNDDNGQNYNPTAFAQNFGNAINRTFLGTVIDKNHNPIPDVTITIGNAMVQTDANGVFIVTDAPVYQRFGYVKAEKAGYISGSRSVVPSEGTNKVQIMLLEETVVGTVNSGTEETVTLSNGTSVNLPGNYSKADGTAYSGSVNVIMHHLDPADEDMQLQMPGMLYAANSENQERLLQTFGMLAVELKGSSGESLNLTEGSTAQITVPLDASLLSDAPATIPLWHFDEEHGYWLEDGEATLVGNAYIGTVSHFSFWNCDIPAEAITISIHVSDNQGNNISNANVVITSEVYGSRYGYTNTLGNVSGLIPSNETLAIVISYQGTNSCPNPNNEVIIYESTIGPFSSDDNIEIVVETGNNSAWVTETVTGTFTDCDENPITEGYMLLFPDDGSYYSDINYIENGTFELSTIRCTTTDSEIFKLYGRDYVNIQETDTLNFTFTSPLTNVGVIAACNSVDEFITYQVDGGETISYYFDINAGFDGANYFYCSHYSSTPTGDPYIFIGTAEANQTSITTGIYTSEFDLYFVDEENNSNPNGNVVDVTVIISSIGEPGEYVDMTFEGTFLDSESNEHTITGTIHAIRDN